MHSDTPATGARHFLSRVLGPALIGCFVSRRDNALLLMIVAAGLALRLLFIDQPMRADESSTFMVYAKGDLASALTYLSPNNHVLHTLFVKAATAMFGGSPEAIRLPALAFGCLSIVLAFCACRRLGSNGLAAATIVSISPYLVLFSTNARGYTLLVCLVLLLLIVGDLFIRRPTAGGATIFALVAALGMLTMPTMAFALAGIFAWMGWCTIARASAGSTPALAQLFWCGVKSVAFSLVLYAPTIWLSGVAALLSNEFVRPQSMGAFASGLRWHVEATAHQFTRDVSWGALAVVGIVCIYGLWRSLRDPSSRIVSLCICLVAGAVALLLATRRIPFERTWIYWIPIVALLADVGLTRAIAAMNGLGRAFLVASFLLAMATPALHTAQGSVAKYDDTGLFTDGPEVGKLLAGDMSDGDGLFIPCCQNYSVFYYLWRFGAPAYSYETRPAQGKTYYVVPQRVPLSEVAGENAQAAPWKTAGSTTIYVSGESAGAPRNGTR